MSHARDKVPVEGTQGKNAAQPVEEESAKPQEDYSRSQERDDAKNLPQPDFNQGSMNGTEKALKSGKDQEVTVPKEEETKETEDMKNCIHDLRVCPNNDNLHSGCICFSIELHNG